MKLVYLTQGQTGSGHVAQALALALGFRRAGLDWEFILVSSSQFLELAEGLGVRCLRIPQEDETVLAPGSYRESVLYNTLKDLGPDILVARYWFSVQHFLPEITGKKVFIFRQIWPEQLRVQWPGDSTWQYFDPAAWDAVYSIEPQEWDVSGPELRAESIPPVIIRSRGEILPREEALARLGLDRVKKQPEQGWCLCATNGEPGEFSELKGFYSHLEDVGYGMYYSSNFQGGIFPAVDYFNAFEQLVLAGGYNSFWEARYFEKEAYFVPFQRVWERQDLRIAHHSETPVPENGADVLVRKLLELVKA